MTAEPRPQGWSQLHQLHLPVIYTFSPGMCAAEGCWGEKCVPLCVFIYLSLLQTSLGFPMLASTSLPHLSLPLWLR